MKRDAAIETFTSSDLRFARWNRGKVVRTRSQRRTGRNRWRAWADRQKMAGLTTRGNLPKRRIEHRILLAEIDAAAAALNEVFHELPAGCRAKCLQLATHLAQLRKKVV